MQLRMERAHDTQMCTMKLNTTAIRCTLYMNRGAPAWIKRKIAPLRPYQHEMQQEKLTWLDPRKHVYTIDASLRYVTGLRHVTHGPV